MTLRNYSNLPFPVLAVIVAVSALFVSPELFAEEPAETPAEPPPIDRATALETMRSSLRSCIIERLGAGARCKIAITRYGRTSIVEAQSADEDVVTIEYDGDSVDMEWSEINDGTLGEIGRASCRERV